MVPLKKFPFQRPSPVTVINYQRWPWCSKDWWWDYKLMQLPPISVISSTDAQVLVFRTCWTAASVSQNVANARLRSSFPGAPKRSQHRAFSFVPKPKILQQRSGSQSRPLGDGAFDGLWMSTATVPSLKSAYSDGGNKVLDVVGLKFFAEAILCRGWWKENVLSLSFTHSLSLFLYPSIYLSLSLSHPLSL